MYTRKSADAESSMLLASTVNREVSDMYVCSKIFPDVPSVKEFANKCKAMLHHVSNFQSAAVKMGLLLCMLWRAFEAGENKAGTQRYTAMYGK